MGSETHPTKKEEPQTAPDAGGNAAIRCQKSSQPLSIYIIYQNVLILTQAVRGIKIALSALPHVKIQAQSAHDWDSLLSGLFQNTGQFS